MNIFSVSPASRRWILTLLAGAGLVAGSAQACSVCQCGDYTINLMGADKPFAGRMRVGVDYSLRTESQGEPGVDERLTHERRTTLGLSYAFSDRFTLAARLPYVDKQFRDTDGTGARGTGLGDVDLAARYVLSDTTVPARQLYGVQGGLRLPTSQQVRQAGTRIDIDGQPGRARPCRALAASMAGSGFRRCCTSVPRPVPMPVATRGFAKVRRWSAR